MVGYFSTIGGMSALSVLVTEAIIKACKIEKKWLKQLVSWLVPVLASCVGLLCQLGLFAAFGPISAWYAWIYTVLTGAGVGLISNGLYEINGVQTLLDTIVKWIESLRKKKEITAETAE